MSFIQKYNKYKNKHLQIGGSAEELNKIAYDLNDDIDYIYDMTGKRIGIIVDTNEYAEQYAENPEPNYYTYVKIDDPEFKPHYVNMRDKDKLYVIANRNYMLPSLPLPPLPLKPSYLQLQPYIPQPPSLGEPHQPPQTAPQIPIIIVSSKELSRDDKRVYIEETYSNGTKKIRVIPITSVW